MTADGVLDLSHCGLESLLEGIGQMAGLRKLDLKFSLFVEDTP